MNDSSHSLRCQVGDLVMIIRSKNPARIWRIGVVICSTRSAAAAAIASPKELTEVLKRDWVVDFQGAPDVTYRDGQPFVTHRLACADVALTPLRAAPDDVECEAFITTGGPA